MQEIWKDIPGTDGQYQASTLGRIQSIYRKNRRGSGITFYEAPFILKQSRDSQGYLNVEIRIDKKRATKHVHSLVAKTFIPNPDNLPQINHLDGDKENNCVLNLKWVTPSENIRHAVETGLKPPPLKGVKGGKHPNSFRVAQYTIEGELVKVWGSCYDAARALNINEGTLSAVSSMNTNAKHGIAYGFQWRKIAKDIDPPSSIPPYIQRDKMRGIKKHMDNHKRPVIQHDIKERYIIYWGSIKAAANYYKCSTWKIRARCNGECKSPAFESIWEYGEI